MRFPENTISFTDAVRKVCSNGGNFVVCPALCAKRRQSNVMCNKQCAEFLVWSLNGSCPLILPNRLTQS